MEVIGIICEYNPFHAGHKKQLDKIRQMCSPQSGIVCLMSGNFVQRGAPAIFDKSIRAEAAVRCGADLVLELPITVSLSSAEGFAAGGVRILSSFCDCLCFGAETADSGILIHAAELLLSDTFPQALRRHLDLGLSFPAARQAALEQMGMDSDFINQPNNILAVEYCKAILQQNTHMKPLPILREGGYHDLTADLENPSASFLRKEILEHRTWDAFIPEAAVSLFQNATRHTTSAGELAILARLRNMTDEEFESIPYGSEGLWRKLMHAARSCATLEEILTSVKSKRYTRTRLNRMIMCAFLGITDAMLRAPIPYIRVLAFNDRGREILNRARVTATFLNAGQATGDPGWLFERRCNDLYGLFAQEKPEAPGAEKRRRVVYVKGEPSGLCD